MYKRQESETIGIVAEQRRVLEEGNRVDRLGACRPSGEFVDQFRRRLLVRQRDIEPAHAAGEQMCIRDRSTALDGKPASSEPSVTLRV